MRRLTMVLMVMLMAATANAQTPQQTADWERAKAAKKQWVELNEQAADLRRAIDGVAPGYTGAFTGAKEYADQARAQLVAHIATLPAGPEKTAREQELDAGDEAIYGTPPVPGPAQKGADELYEDAMERYHVPWVVHKIAFAAGDLAYRRRDFDLMDDKFFGNGLLETDPGYYGGCVPFFEQNIQELEGSGPVQEGAIQLFTDSLSRYMEAETWFRAHQGGGPPVAALYAPYVEPRYTRVTTDLLSVEEAERMLKMIP